LCIKGGKAALPFDMAFLWFSAIFDGVIATKIKPFAE
jgi:hypothetical protein